jgi:chemotaxis family two-component system sensor kinase Cph1
LILCQLSRVGGATRMATSPDISASLDECAREPIRIPGAVQPHGALLVVDESSLHIQQLSDNAPALLNVPLVPGAALSAVLDPGSVEVVARWRSSGESQLMHTVRIAGQLFQLSAHRSPQGMVLEFEAGPIDDRETLAAVYPRLRVFVDSIALTSSVRTIGELAVQEIRTLTGFNRIMLYSFDAAGDGTVIAEANDGVLPSYLDLRFPASDIPAQARELYKTNRLRLIPNAAYRPALIEPAASPVDGQPLDLSGAALRSVSPIHLEYMRNMGTGASMSLSILIDGELWGLISCHNRDAKIINAQIRSACDFLGQIVSLQIGARERAERSARRIALKAFEGQLLAQLSSTADFHAGVAADKDSWLKFIDADGVAVVSSEGVTAVGLTPSTPELQELAKWLHGAVNQEVFSTDSLALHWPPAEGFAYVASGIMSMSLSQLNPSYIMWFRQEVVRTVQWGGDPRKDPTALRLHPRKSFEIWKQQVRLKSIPWSPVELEAAQDLRNSMINFVLRRAEERAALSEKLEKSNAELEAFSYSVSHDLRAPFRHIVGYADLLSFREKALDEKSRHYLDSIVDSARHAGRLVDDLLAFSQMGRTALSSVRVDMQKLVAEVKRSREPDLQGRSIEWQIGELPPTQGDPSLMRQVWANLIDNALKYSIERPTAEIRIEAEPSDRGVSYSVTDNGVGFEMAYVGKLFGVFQRLHRSESYPGTGIGLALVKRIIDRHGGRVWARGEVDRGASIGFVLPLVNQEGSHGRS